MARRTGAPSQSAPNALTRILAEEAISQMVAFAREAAYILLSEWVLPGGMGDLAKEYY